MGEKEEEKIIKIIRKDTLPRLLGGLVLGLANLTGRAYAEFGTVQIAGVPMENPLTSPCATSSCNLGFVITPGFAIFGNFGFLLLGLASGVSREAVRTFEVACVFSRGEEAEERCFA